MKRVYEIRLTATFTNTETGTTMSKGINYPLVEETADAAIAKAQTAERIGMIVATYIPQQHQRKVTCTVSNITANAK
jgi:hypothetical protein